MTFALMKLKTFEHFPHFSHLISFFSFSEILLRRKRDCKHSWK